MDEMSLEKVLQSVQDQLKQEIEQGNSYKNKIQDLYERNQKLQKDIMKRDKILELCLNKQNELHLTSTTEGSRIFDIRNKEQVPYWIKTEQLSPLIHENSEEVGEHENIQKEADIDDEDDCAIVDVIPLSQNPVENLIKENQQKNVDVDNSAFWDNFIESVNDSSYSTVPSNSKETSGYFSELPGSSRVNNKRRFSQSPIPTEHLNIKKFKFDSPEKKEETTKTSLSISDISSTSSIESPPHQNFSPPVPIQSNSENVLDIPEIFRSNFGTCDFECPVGLKFWFDSENSHYTKFFLKLHDDSGNWRMERNFVLIEQIGLSYPKTHHLKFNKILEKLNNSKNKRIWLDVRDFDIFSPSGQKIFGESIEKSITHFSFGSALYSKDELTTNRLMDFIFDHLPSLEYLSVNNQMLCSFDTQEQPKLVKKLHKLETIRLIHKRIKFSFSFISILLKSSPNLQFLYGIPLNYLNMLLDGKNKILKDQVEVRTIFILRSEYKRNENTALNFERDLQTLTTLKNWNTLEQFEAQLYFLQCGHSVSSKCINPMSRVLQRHANSIKKLKLEPFHDSNKMLWLSRMKNLTTLQFDVNRRGNQKQTSFFPRGFDMNENFPALNSIEILMDLSNLNFLCSPKETPLDLFEKLFPPNIFKTGQECFNRVKSLSLRGFFKVGCMPRLAQLFPNVKVLRLYCDLMDAASLLPLFYKLWPGVEQLHLEIDVDTRYGNLDSALCGMDFKSCALIRRENSLPHKEIEEEEYQEYCKKHAIHSSIRSMKNLQLLNFVLRQEVEISKFRLPIFSQVGTSALSGVGVGKRENKFKVHFSFDEKLRTKDIEEIISVHSSVLSLPFVTLNR